MIDTNDPHSKKRLLASRGTATVGASSVAELTTITIADGWVIHLTRAEADFTGTTLATSGRGLVIREELSGGNTDLLRAQTDGSSTPHTSSLMYYNDNGETATIALRGFHADAASQDMFGHMTWEGVAHLG